MGEHSSAATSLRQYKRTKMVVTVGPATDSYEAVKSLLAAGANGFRLNYGHGSFEERAEQIGWIRRAAKELDKPVAIIQDLPGPRLQLGDFDSIINVQAGQTLKFGVSSSWNETGVIPIEYDLSTCMKRGEELYLYDGRLRTTVTSVKDGMVFARAENNGILVQHKTVHAPATDFGGNIITESDRQALAYGSEQDIDYVSLGQVQSADDVERLRRALKSFGSVRKIIAKIETRQAVENLAAIMQAADAVLVSGSGLAVAMPPEAVPVVQRQAIELARTYGKPSLVAVQLLAAVSEMPTPTSAEVSAVATAVLTGADSVLLGDETASGKYPLEAVRQMKRIILYTQSHVSDSPESTRSAVTSRQTAISQALVQLARDIQAAAIVAETASGATALQIAAERPDIPLLAVTSTWQTAQQLALVYGVKAYVRTMNKLTASRLTDFLRQTKVLGKGDIVVMASSQQPGVVGTTDTIKVRQLD
jgi:pyruvate kinase